MSRLKDFYEAQIVPEMTKKFSYTNKLAVPKLKRSSSTWALAKQEKTLRFWMAL